VKRREQRYPPGVLYRKNRRRRLSNGSNATPWARRTDRTTEDVEAKGAALPPGELYRPPTLVMRTDWRYHPGELY
jgi:hypothetical protein